MQELKKNYTIVIVTHNMQQAARASDYTAMMMLSKDGERSGTVIEFDETNVIFTRPEATNARKIMSPGGLDNLDIIG